MKEIKSKILQGDKIIWMIYVFFIIISIVEVFSAMGKKVSTGSFVPMLFFHCLWLFLGFVCCFIVHRIDYRKITRYLKIFLIISIALTITPYIAAVINNDVLSTARWIRINLGFYRLQLQPSELAKYLTIFYICGIMSVKQEVIKTKKVFVSLMGPLIFICFIIFWSNFSTSALIFLTCFLLMRIGGVNKKYLYLTLLVLLCFVGFMVFIAYLSPEFASKIGRLGTIVSRTEGHHNIDYTQITQANQALIAVSTGGLLGCGIGNSIQSRFLEEGHNDFIFSIILEEGGIWLGGFIILLYIILLYRMFKTAMKVQGYFGAMACIGMGLVLTLQTLINMSVAVGLLPVTGQTLPFISYGGTSFVVASVFLGVILNISKRVENTPKSEIAGVKEDIEQQEIKSEQTTE